MRIKNFNNFINEGIRDQMVSKSDSQVKDAMDKTIKEFEHHIENEYVNIFHITKLIEGYKNFKDLDDIDLIIFLDGFGTFAIDFLLDNLIDTDATGVDDESVEDVIKKYNSAPRRRLLEILYKKGYIEYHVVLDSIIEELVHEAEFDEILRLLSEIKKSIQE